MKNKFLTLFILAAIIMLLFPYLTITFVKGESGLIVCSVLFFIINPLYSIISGIYAGKYWRRLWLIPIITGLLFILGTWLFYEMGEGAFVVYGALYSIIGAFAMFLSAIVRKKLFNVKKS